MIEILLKLLGLTALGYTSFQDFKTEKFSVYPVIFAAAPALIHVDTWFVPGLTLFLSIIAIRKTYIRPGDTLPLLLYTLTFPSLQSIFTLLTVTGLYLAIYKEAFPEKEWIPYLPAILTSYIIQLMLYLPLTS